VASNKENIMQNMWHPTRRIWYHNLEKLASDKENIWPKLVAIETSCSRIIHWSETTCSTIINDLILREYSVTITFNQRALNIF
jgi:hypothetical protein